MLREHLKQYDISLLNFCITSNHTYLLVRPDPSRSKYLLSRFMQNLEGDFAQHYNLRKNSFWGDRYHSTMVDTGEHL